MVDGVVVATADVGAATVVAVVVVGPDVVGVATDVVGAVLAGAAAVVLEPPADGSSPVHAASAIEASRKADVRRIGP